jgi:hypothetical protein
VLGLSGKCLERAQPFGALQQSLRQGEIGKRDRHPLVERQKAIVAVESRAVDVCFRGTPARDPGSRHVQGPPPADRPPGFVGSADQCARRNRG